MPRRKGAITVPVLVPVFAAFLFIALLDMISRYRHTIAIGKKRFKEKKKKSGAENRHCVSIQSRHTSARPPLVSGE